MTQKTQNKFGALVLRSTISLDNKGKPMNQQTVLAYAMRVIVRLHEQVFRAYEEDRAKDACSIAKLIGTLQYRHFGAAGCGFEDMA
jgi:hypothetical protein